MHTWRSPLRPALLILLLALIPAPGLASPTSDVAKAEEALQAGNVAVAAATLRQALTEAERIKPRTRGLAWVLLGEALLKQAHKAEFDKESPRALRDLRLEALAAGYQALTMVYEEPIPSRARVVVEQSRHKLFEQAVEQVRGEHPQSVSRWIDGLEALEGETLESLALRGMREARAGNVAVGIARMEAATLTADQPETAIRTPALGHTYTEQARAILKQDPAATNSALAVLERGLAWRVRASTELDDAHDLALRRVRRELEAERLDLLLELPDRQTEALFAVEATFRDNIGNVRVVDKYGPWLEAHDPTRALTLYRDMASKAPQLAALPKRIGALLLRRARSLDAELVKARDNEERDTLRLRQQTWLREASEALDRALGLDPDDAEVQAMRKEVRTRQAAAP